MSQVDKNISTNSDEVSLKDLILKIREWFTFLLSKWVIILFAGIIGGGIGLAYSIFKKPIYNAELSFALEDDKASGGGLGAAMGLASQFGIDLAGAGGAGGAFTGDNLMVLMKSRSMVESALLTSVDIKGKKETLAELYVSFNKIREKWNDKPELNNIHFLPGADRSKFTLQQDSVLGRFYELIVKDNLSVGKADKKLSIITVKVGSTDEFFSKCFTEVLTKTVSDFYINTKTKKATQNVNILQHQTDSVRRELNAALTGVALSVDINPNANPLLQTLRVPSQRRQVDVTANTAILGELVKNLEITKMSLLRETPLIQVIDKPIYPLKKERFGNAKGIVMGGFLAGLLTCLILVSRRLLTIIMNS